MSWTLADGDVIEAKTFAYQDNQVGLNIHHFQVEGVFGTPSLQQANEAISQALGDVLKTMLNNSAEFLGTKSQRVFPGLTTGVVETTLGSGPGTAGPTVMPKQTAGIITWRTALAGRSNRGRTYIPFPANEDNQGEGEPTPGYVAKLNNLKTIIVNGINFTDTMNGAVLRKIIWNIGGVAGEQVTDATARQKWATQRRRGDYGAANPRPL